MGIDINDTILSSSAGLIATNAGKQLMKMGPTGTLQRYNLGQPMFRAGGTSGSWTAIGTSVWAVVPGITTTDVNVGTCYNTANSVFTAPVTGVYMLAAHAYLLINVAGGYSHPMFWVNGSSSARRATPAGAQYRIRGHGITAGYSVDNSICECIPLVANDYVQFYSYCGNSVSMLPAYSRFEGYLLF